MSGGLSGYYTTMPKHRRGLRNLNFTIPTNVVVVRGFSESFALTRNAIAIGTEIVDHFALFLLFLGRHKRNDSLKRFGKDISSGERSDVASAHGNFAYILFEIVFIVDFFETTFAEPHMLNIGGPLVPISYGSGLASSFISLTRETKFPFIESEISPRTNASKWLASNQLGEFPRVGEIAFLPSVRKFLRPLDSKFVHVLSNTLFGLPSKSNESMCDHPSQEKTRNILLGAGVH